jgi:hypothetical protein
MDVPVAVENDAGENAERRKMPRTFLFYTSDPNLIEDGFLRALQEENRTQAFDHPRQRPSRAPCFAHRLEFAEEPAPRADPGRTV